MTEEIYAQVSWKRGDDIVVLHAPDGTTLYALADTLGLKDAVDELLTAVQNVPSVGHDGGTKSIPVTSIEFGAVTKNNSTSWKVKGGWAEKFGITCYEEVITEAGIPVDKLKTDEPNIPQGNWTAFYDEWEDDGKTRRKVTKLVKA